MDLDAVLAELESQLEAAPDEPVAAWIVGITVLVKTQQITIESHRREIDALVDGLKIAAAAAVEQRHSINQLEVELRRLRSEVRAPRANPSGWLN
jgi:uncharacterized coiled-coil protein SlyX